MVHCVDQPRANIALSFGVGHVMHIQLIQVRLKAGSKNQNALKSCLVKTLYGFINSVNTYHVLVCHSTF